MSCYATFLRNRISVTFNTFLFISTSESLIKLIVTFGGSSSEEDPIISMKAQEKLLGFAFGQSFFSGFIILISYISFRLGGLGGGGVGAWQAGANIHIIATTMEHKKSGKS